MLRTKVLSNSRGYPRSLTRNSYGPDHPLLPVFDSFRPPSSRILHTMATEIASDALKEYFPLSLSDFNTGVTLGTGSFGRVKFVTHKDANSIWALKMLKKSEVIRLQQVEHMISEKTILSALNHPFIVTMAGTFQGEYCGKPASRPHLVTFSLTSRG
jgi:serine/threonine protein kinase